MPDDFPGTKGDTTRPDDGEGGNHEFHWGKVIEIFSQKGHPKWRLISCKNNQQYVADPIPVIPVLGLCDRPEATNFYFTVIEGHRVVNLTTHPPLDQPMVD